MTQLKKLIIAAVEYKYIRVLEQAETGLGAVTCRSILDHLFQRYGTMTREEIEEN
jgi:hypothetical protein